MKKLARTFAGLAALAIVAAPARAEDDPDLARLADGVSHKQNWEPPGTGQRYGHAEVLVHAPMAAVKKVVLDYAHYKDLVPEKFHTSRLVAKENGATDVYLQVPIMHGMVTLWEVMRFREIVPLAPGWAMVEGWFVRGNVKSANVAWTLHAIGDDYTVLKFDLLTLPSMPAPQSAIDEELRDAAMNAVDAVRDKAQGTPGPQPYAKP